MDESEKDICCLFIHHVMKIKVTSSFPPFHLYDCSSELR